MTRAPPISVRRAAGGTARIGVPFYRRAFSGVIALAHDECGQRDFHGHEKNGLFHSKPLLPEF